MGPRRADTFIAYAKARNDSEQELAGFRSYMSELVRMQAQGKTFTKSYVEVLEDARRPQRSAEDIIEEVTRNAGLEVRS